MRLKTVFTAPTVDFWYGGRTDVQFALIFFFINGLVLPFATGILLFPHCCWRKEVRRHIQYQHVSDVEFRVESDSGFRISELCREV